MKDVTTCAEPPVIAPGNGHHCPERDRKWVLVVAILASALGFIDGSIVSIAIPAIREGLGASFTDIQWIMNAYVLVLTALILPGGAFGDKFGQHRVFAVGIMVFLLASIACGIAPSAEFLIWARALKGVGAALMIPGSLALISKNFPKKERGKAIGLWSAAAGLTTALGPVLGGWVLMMGGEAAWRWIFYLNIPLGGIALFFLFLRIPKDAGNKNAKIDTGGAVMAIAALGLVAYGLTALGEGTNVGPLIFLLGLVGLVGFILFEFKTAHPMIPPTLFTSPAFSGANALTFVLYLAMGGVLFFTPMTLIETQGISEVAVGTIFIPMTVIMAGLARWAGGLADRVGTKMPLTLGPFITGLALAALAFAVPSGHFYSAVLPAMALLGVGMGIAVPPLSTAVMNAADDQYAGAASGVNNAVARMAQLFAVAGLGIIASLVYREVMAGALPLDQMGADINALGFGEDLSVDKDRATAAVEAAQAHAMEKGFRALALTAAGLALLSA
ncbi:MAG: MFS transporter, partial [Pseudomonadota bacterium]